MKKTLIPLLFILLTTLNIYSQDVNGLNTENIEQIKVRSALENSDEQLNTSDLEIYKQEEEKREQASINKEIAKEIISQSLIEKNYRSISDNSIKQFGYDYLLLDSVDKTLSTNSNYLLGVGDTLKVYIWGYPVDTLLLQSQYKLVVDRNGSLYFPAIGLIDVVGKSVLEAEDIITASLNQKYKNFNLELVVSEFKTFNVSVSGMINSPGQVSVSGLSTLLNGLNRAGGVLKEGSLRDITLKRGETVYSFDLYDILIHGNNSIQNFLLKEGDSIYVNPIRSVVAITGAVKRPGIYELKDNETVNDIIKFAGGGLTTTLNRDAIVYELDRDMGSLVSVESDNVLDYKLTDGTLIEIPSTELYYADSIMVTGAIRNPGRLSLKEAEDLQTLMTHIKLKPNINMYFAELIRRVPGEIVEYLSFIPTFVLNGEQNLKLQPGDTIKFISHNDDNAVNKNLFTNAISVSGLFGGTMAVSYYDGLTLNQVLEKMTLPVDLNMHYAQIVRHVFGKEKEYITFSPNRVLNGELIIELTPRDSVNFVNMKRELDVNDYYFKDIVEVKGILGNDQTFAWHEGMLLNDILTESMLTKDTNMFYGEIYRNEIGENREYITFSLSRVLNSIDAILLQPGDTIRISNITEELNVNKNYFRDIVTVINILGVDLTVSWHEGLTLNEIVTESMLPVDINMDYASIIRYNDHDNNKQVINFSLEEMFGGKDITLKPLDTVQFYPKWEYKPITISGAVENSELLTYYPGISLIDVLRGVELNATSDELRARVVQESGVHNIYLYDLLVLGNPSSNIKLDQGAKVLIQEVTDREQRNKIKLFGEVNKPGVYTYEKNMTLYDLLSKADGLREAAYLQGIVLIRNSVKNSQLKQLDLTINSMSAHLDTVKLEAAQSGLSGESSVALASQIAVHENTLQLTRAQAEQALGRISLKIPGTIEELKTSDENIGLEEGDYIFIPKEPNYVIVMGNVYNQISISYNEDLRVRDYINNVGGFKDNSGEAYIVHVNGEITSGSKGWFSAGVLNNKLKPGDMIVVPQEVKVPARLIFLDTLDTVTDIIYKSSTAVFSSYSLLESLGAIESN